MDLETSFMGFIVALEAKISDFWSNIEIFYHMTTSTGQPHQRATCRPAFHRVGRPEPTNQPKRSSPLHAVFQEQYNLVFLKTTNTFIKYFKKFLYVLWVILHFSKSHTKLTFYDNKKTNNSNGNKRE